MRGMKTTINQQIISTINENWHDLCRIKNLLAQIVDDLTPIAVSERLPEFDTEVLGFCINHWRRTWLCGARKEWIDGEFRERGIPFPALAKKPSHWRPMPPNPETA